MGKERVLAGMGRSAQPRLRVDTVVLGGGSAGEAFCAALRRLDKERSIALVEAGLLGGECSYWACMPSKVLLRGPELVAAARLAPGVAEAVEGSLDLERLFWWRDQVVEGWDDASHADWLASLGVDVRRGQGRVVGRGELEVEGTTIAYENLVVATGSSPSIPPIPGLEEVDFWTTAQATAAREVPGRLVVLGGGVAGCELAQLFSRLGSQVTVVHRRSLLPRLDRQAGEILEATFAGEGIELRLGVSAERVERTGGGILLGLSDGSEVRADRLLVATGRRPNVRGLGLELTGARLSERGIEVDDRLQAAPGTWAVGDATGVALFTHVGKYQARVAATNVAGGEARVDYRAIPAVVFTDPQVAQVGTVTGEGLVSASWPVERTSRASTYERPKRKGFLKLVADRKRRVLVGGVAVGPEAGEWLQQVTLAIQAEVPVDTLRRTIQPFPTFSEAVFFAARDLPL